MDTENTDKAVGGWLIAAALLLITALAFHPPPPGESAAFQELIADEGDTWVFAHWLAAAALSAFVVTGLLALTSGLRSALARSAWALLSVGALATTITAVAEATAISAAARAGDMTTFAAWQGFAAGTSMGFAVMALAFAGIAWSVARASAPAVPRWSSRGATFVAVVSSAAWIANMGLGIAVGGPIWLVTALIINLWLVWYGIALLRAAVPARQGGTTHA